MEETKERLSHVDDVHPEDKECPTCLKIHCTCDEDYETKVEMEREPERLYQAEPSYY